MAPVVPNFSSSVRVFVGDPPRNLSAFVSFLSPAKKNKKEMSANKCFSFFCPMNGCTMGQNQVVLSHRIIHFSTNSGVDERARKRVRAAERAIIASEQVSSAGKWRSKRRDS